MDLQPSAQHVIVIEDDDLSAQASVHAALAAAREIRCEHVRWDALERDQLRRPSIRVVVAVAGPTHARLLPLLESIDRDGVATPVVAVLSEGDDELVRQAIRVADDFLFVPIRPLELRHRIARLLSGACRSGDAFDRALEDIGLARLIGRDPAFVRALRLVPRFAKVSDTVLVTGETGTGKELFARAIHHLSARRHAPFIAVDCGAIPDQLFENEIFGHARGAFTDAHRDQRGQALLADGGTLFLDEIDSLSLTAQSKLLRFLQDHTFRPLGGEHSERANVRVIAASNRDLEGCLEHKEFRADLFFRLNILRLHLPPLRERRDDIPLLAQRMLEDLRADGAPPAKSLSPAALRVLKCHAWPGNVRELWNVVHRAVVECDGGTILPEHVALTMRSRPEPLRFRAARAEVVASFERHYVEDLLRKHGGNVTHAAREADQDRRAFGRVIKKYNIDRRAL
jgi:two-component system response regulator GlrR